MGNFDTEIKRTHSHIVKICNEIERVKTPWMHCIIEMSSTNNTKKNSKPKYAILYERRDEYFVWTRSTLA